jgi:hypothetical protein
VICTLLIHGHRFTLKHLCWHLITKILRNGPEAHFPFSAPCGLVARPRGPAPRCLVACPAAPRPAPHARRPRARRLAPRWPRALAAPAPSPGPTSPAARAPAAVPSPRRGSRAPARAAHSRARDCGYAMFNFWFIQF